MVRAMEVLYFPSFPDSLHVHICSADSMGFALELSTIPLVDLIDKFLSKYFIIGNSILGGQAYKRFAILKLRS